MPAIPPVRNPWPHDQPPRHVVGVSGGEASARCAKRVQRWSEDPADVAYVFTDTLIEDADLYRFLIESMAWIQDVDRPEIAALARGARNLPEVFPPADMEERRHRLKSLAEEAMDVIPNFFWLQDGRTPWEVFRDERFMGNTRVDPCSKILKRHRMRRWCDHNADPDQTDVHIGLTVMEAHRLDTAWAGWQPFDCRAPLIEDPPVGRNQVREDLKDAGLEIPRLYKMGFAHNNCGGFCVKAGRGAFKLLLHKRRPLFLHHEHEEAWTRKFLWAHRVALKLNARHGSDCQPEDVVEMYRDRGRPLGELDQAILRDRSRAGILGWLGITEADVVERVVGYQEVEPDGDEDQTEIFQADDDAREEPIIQEFTPWGRKIPNLRPLTLREFRQKVEAGEMEDVDMYQDQGGCGCMLDFDSDELEGADV